ncbi:iron-sulfur cluster assembly scaffold protein [Candidatus Manganitrophus noduliformans]|uniref:iron-sulfur cluster assembly scaffold protein n=1 Tax=Candidatus Manganitrophus noduliformans TaxID=2606439 RepID=UPI002A4E2E0E|nr:iron-sulfur cluster assembly scaffold protein [Candidatus Manganitrophus noduliformans]
MQEHARRPRNVGSLENPDIRHEEVNPFCGDRIRIEAILDCHRRVAEIRFRGDACMISQAAGSILTEMIKGWPIEAIERLKEADLLKALEAPLRPARIKCALLPLEILQSGVASYRRLHAVS